MARRHKEEIGKRSGENRLEGRKSKKRREMGKGGERRNVRQKALEDGGTALGKNPAEGKPEPDASKPVGTKTL